MDLRKLEIFACVAQTKNFSRAAASLHMAQPAVSIAIRKLEEEFDTRLFDRSGRQARLTAEGARLLVQAQRILREVDELKHTNSSLRGLLLGNLNIACPAMLATYFLPDLLSGFLHEHPGLQASVTQAGTAQIQQMLLHDEIEVGVTTVGDMAESTELELLPLVSEQLVICMAADHPWAGRRRITLKDLHQTPMVVYESGYFIRSKLDELCQAQGVQPEYRFQTNFLPLLTHMVKQGLGTMPGLKVMATVESGLSGVALSPRTDVTMALARRRGRSLSRANLAFWDWVAHNTK